MPRKLVTYIGAVLILSLSSTNTVATTVRLQLPNGESIDVRQDRTWKYALHPATPINDIDGNEYKTVEVGEGVWMAENLRTTHFSNGDPIENITDFKAWWAAKRPGFASYNNEPISSPDQGLLYNWYAASDSRSVCPSGWKVPTKDQWQSLINLVGLSDQLLAKIKSSWPKDSPNPHGFTTGRLFMSAAGWPTDRAVGDPLGISIIPTGWRAMANGFNFGGKGYPSASFYTSEIIGDDPFFVTLSSSIVGSTNFDQISLHNYSGANPKDSRVFGLSIRCIRIEAPPQPFPSAAP